MLHFPFPVRTSMAGGGEGAKVAPYDLAIIVGVVGLIGAIGIYSFALPHTVSLESGEHTSVRMISTGILGSDDTVSIEVTNLGGEGSTNCTITRASLKNSQGEEVDSVTPESQNGEFSATLSANGEKGVTLGLSGEGDCSVAVDIQRQIPFQFLPPAFSLLLLVWGIWRKSVDPGPDEDIDVIVEQS